MEAPGGRAVLQFEGHPAILTLVQFIVAPPPEPEPEYEPAGEPEEEEPEEVPEEDDDVEVVLVDDEEPVGNGFLEVDDEEPLGNGFLEVEDGSDVTDDEMLG